MKSDLFYGRRKILAPRGSGRDRTGDDGRHDRVADDGKSG